MFLQINEISYYYKKKGSISSNLYLPGHHFCTAVKKNNTSILVNKHNNSIKKTNVESAHKTHANTGLMIEIHELSKAKDVTVFLFSQMYRNLGCDIGVPPIS